MLLALSWEAWVTLGVIGLLMVALVRDLARPDLVLFSGLGILLGLGVLTPSEAFAGLSNDAVLAVGALFIVAAGVENTGALSIADHLLFQKKGGNLSLASGRLMFVTASMSAFFNNTPIVAMLIPRVQMWCDQHDVSTSKLMIPLSYGAIIGGMTTLIGTSTNLLVSGLMTSSGYEGLAFFDLAWAGVPAALAVIVYFALIGHRLLPERNREGVGGGGGQDAGLFELRIPAGSPFVGRSVEEAGLRALKDAFLVHIQRNGDVLPSSPDTLFREGDVLMFQGSLRVLDRLLDRDGLERVITNVDKPRYSMLPLFDAVVAPTSRLVGKSLKEVGFREEYHGVVLGIRRRDELVEGPLGRIPIKAGDLLLIEGQPGFDQRWNANREEFYLVAARRPEKAEPQQRKAPLALAILIGVILVAALGYASIVTTSFIGALAMIATRCVRGLEARRSVDIPVLLVIAAALGLGKAIEKTGLADALAGGIISIASGYGPIAVVAAVFIATSILTEFITNNAAAALMLGIALSAATNLGAPPEAFAVAVAIAASASFLTPIGYQTNLMVMAAGGYRFSDYFRTGLFVNLIVMSVSLFMIWWVWL